MGKQFSEISKDLQEFIEEQKIFFVGTATADSKVNVSPKGMESFRVMGPNQVLWLNVTGSGNETAAHITENSRMTIMFTAFTGKPMILRLYGQAKAIHRNDPEWGNLFSLFPPIPGARQIFNMEVEMVQTSCGMAVPFYDYQGERDQLNTWAANKGEEGIKNYWEEKNQKSLDGIPTHILDKNL
jgi:hypothetical protein